FRRRGLRLVRSQVWACIANDQRVEPSKTCGEPQSNPHANYTKWEGRPCLPRRSLGEGGCRPTYLFFFRVISRLPRRSRRRAEAGVTRVTLSWHAFQMAV